jgi:hypothetical protein
VVDIEEPPRGRMDLLDATRAPVDGGATPPRRWLRDLAHHTWSGLLVLTGRDILLAGLLVAVVRLLVRQLRGSAAG